MSILGMFRKKPNLYNKHTQNLAVLLTKLNIKSAGVVDLSIAISTSYGKILRPHR